MTCCTDNSFIMAFPRNIINKLLLNIHYYGKVEICYTDNSFTQTADSLILKLYKSMDSQSILYISTMDKDITAELYDILQILVVFTSQQKGLTY